MNMPSLIVVVKELTNLFMTEFLISSYSAPLAQRASYLALHSSLSGQDGTVNYDILLLTVLTPC